MKIFENDFTVENAPVIDAEIAIEEAPVVEIIPEPVVVAPVKVEEKKVVEPVKKFKKVAIETDCGLKIVEVEDK